VSPLIGVWKCTAKDAHREYFCDGHDKLGMSASDIAVKLEGSLSYIVAQIEYGHLVC
jgi:hypothetical protein